MTTWVLFIYAAYGPAAIWNYDTEAACLKDADKYKRAACVKVIVPASTSTNAREKP